VLKRDELANPKSCLNKANDDEYLFVLLQRDPASGAAIMAWVNSRLALGLNKATDPQIVEAVATANGMTGIDAPTGPGWWCVSSKDAKAFVYVVEMETGPIGAPSKVELAVSVVGEQQVRRIDDLRFRGCKWAKH
jgi:hypothetical protein